MGFKLCHNWVIRITAGNYGFYLRVNLEEPVYGFFASHPARNGKIQDYCIKLPPGFFGSDEFFQGPSSIAGKVHLVTQVVKHPA